MAKTARLILYSGIAGDYDGTYEWVPDDEYDNPAHTVGEHSSDWPGEGYEVIEVINQEDPEGG